MAVCYMFSLIFLLFVHGAISAKQPPLEYDFEVADVPSEISRQRSVSLSTGTFKEGAKSLKWEWAPSQQLKWDLSSKSVKARSYGGIQIWIYLSKKLSGKCLSVCVRVKEKSSRTRSCFPMSLNFVGWRAAWVGYKEFIGCRPPSDTWNSLRRSSRNSYSKVIDEFSLIAPSSASIGNPLYIDLLRFVGRISKVTRDSIVPPLTYNNPPQERCINCARLSKIREQDALSRNRRKLYWQQIYRWSIKSAPQAAAKVDFKKLAAMKEIERRLVNWYADESSTFTKIPHTISPSDPFLDQRWNDLVKNFNRSRQKWAEFTKPPGKLSSGLFARNSEFGKLNKSEEVIPGDPRKFSDIFFKVLHPLAMEYHIKSRRIEVDHVACLFAKKYQCNSGASLQPNDIEAISGEDTVGKNIFKAEYKRSITSNSSAIHATCSNVRQACFDHVAKAIEKLNKHRKQNILELFTYIKDQGWQEGSGLGSMDHALLGMSGFAHSVFLMRNELKTSRKLDDVIADMKWYMEFGEVYQTSFEYKGTTADRTRTVLLFRLITVLIMPEDNDIQQKEKVRDMDALKLWIENALSITEGLSDLIKPDYTCYHHRFFYAAAYCPAALHTAALVSYLLDETVYQLESNIKENLINAFKVYRIAAVHYSTPSQIGGRNPKYDREILAEHVPGFAYLAMKSPFRNKYANFSKHPNLNKDLAEVSMFLRLYKHTTESDVCVGKLNKQMCKGQIGRKYYLNTLGSLKIMDRVKLLANDAASNASKQWHYRAEKSPSGHWSKQFASLSIHRRSNWAVSVKGFDKSVPDFESSLNPVGNLYGMYSSHGAMLIANSECALSSKDVDKGWDWRKIPGTTAINVPFSEMKKVPSLHYNPSSNAMAGGVSFRGSRNSAEENGVFGMDFELPIYKVPIPLPFDGVTFRFKKSVFFYDDLIVSLGSNIEYSGKSNDVHTTLFQDLMRKNNTPKASEADVFRCNDGGSLTKTAWQKKASVRLVDVNGNRYYIPDPDKQGLVFARNQLQHSFKGNEKEPTATNATYCTAWFNHGTGSSLSTSGYEYAVQVDAEPVGGQSKQVIGSTTYKVIKKTKKAHVVKFPATSKRGTVYGYVVFINSASSPVTLGKRGPLTSAFHQSVIMTEETTNPARLYIGVNSAKLNLQEKPNSPSWCRGGTTSPRFSKDVDETLLFCSKSTDQDVHVNLRNNAKWLKLISLKVDGSSKVGNKDHYLTAADPLRKKPLQFINLRNGATTEVELGGTSKILA